MINNINASNAIVDCNAELSRITGIIDSVGSMSHLSNYLTKYSLIRICGTLEVCYKTIIADYYEKFALPEHKDFYNKSAYDRKFWQGN